MSDFKPTYDYYSNSKLRNSKEYYIDKCINNLVYRSSKTNKIFNEKMVCVIHQVLFSLAFAYEFSDDILCNSKDTFGYSSHTKNGYYAVIQYKNVLRDQFCDNGRIINTNKFCNEFYSYLMDNNKISCEYKAEKMSCNDTCNDNMKVNYIDIIHVLFDLIASVTAHPVNIKTNGMSDELSTFIMTKIKQDYNPIFGNFGIITRNSLTDDFGISYSIKCSLDLQNDFNKHLNISFVSVTRTDCKDVMCEYISDNVILNVEKCNVNVIDCILNLNELMSRDAKSSGTINYLYKVFACIYDTCCICCDINSKWYKMCGNDVFKIDPKYISGIPKLILCYRLKKYV